MNQIHCCHFCSSHLVVKVTEQCVEVCRRSVPQTHRGHRLGFGVFTTIMDESPQNSLICCQFLAFSVVFGGFFVSRSLLTSPYTKPCCTLASIDTTHDLGTGLTGFSCGADVTILEFETKKFWKTAPTNSLVGFLAFSRANLRVSTNNYSRNAANGKKMDLSSQMGKTDV